MIRSAAGLAATLVLLLPQTGTAEAPTAVSAPFESGAFADYQPNTKNGEVVFNAAGCAYCHAVEGDTEILAGGREIKTKFGAIYTPNITADPDHGIGNWSNATFLNAILLGQKPNGDDYYGAVFPFAAYAYMTPEDALDLRGYMASLPTSDAVSKAHEVNFANAMVLGRWTEEPVALSAAEGAQMQRGQYLTEALGHCGECHTPRLTGLGFKYQRDESQAYMGESGILGGYAPNISAANLTAFAPEAFVTGTLREGKKLNGKPMTDPRMRHISDRMGQLPIEDRAAIYAYLTGTPLDAATLPKEEPRGDTVAPVVEAVVVEDRTGAEALVARVNAYCEAQEVDTAALANAKVPGSVGSDAALAAEVDALVETHCRNCHGPGQTNQRSFFTGDLDYIARDPSNVISGDPSASPLYESVASNRMPIGSKITPEELQTIGRWITELKTAPVAAAPVAEPVVASAAAILPRFAGGTFEEQVLAASRDMSEIPEQDRRFIRYFSFASIPLPPIDCAEEGALRNPMTYLHAGMNKFINSVSRGNNLAPIEPVAGTDGALVRIDMRNYGWSADDWQALTTAAYTEGAAEAGWDPAAWAELAAVYPYAVAPEAQPLLVSVAGMTGASVPVLRAEWFVRHASESPYYDMLLRLPADIRVLETRMGVNVEEAIRAGDVLRTGFTGGTSGVSDHNRMLERHSLPRGGYYWKSYDFAGSDGAQSLIQHPDGPGLLSGLSSGTEGFEHDGGEMIFSLANGMQGYYLSTHEGERLTVGPTSIVSFRTKPIGKGVEIVNARSCFDCHSNGIIAKRDQLRPFIESSGQFSLPQRDALLAMYRPQEEVDAAYRGDAAQFTAALDTLGATEASPDGRPVSIRAPESTGGGEIVTYLADLYFENLTDEDVAREFFMDPAALRERVKGIADPSLRLLAETWVQRLDRDLFVTRAEMEEHWQALLPRLTRLTAMQSQVPHAAPAAQDLTAALTQGETYGQQAFVPANNAHLAEPVQTYVAGEGLTLSLSVPAVNTRVGDLLAFDVSANRRCELQILYVEEGNVVEELPQAVLGAAFLEPGEQRRIPDPKSGLQLRFNTPGKGETMVAFCREGGLGDQRINATDAIAAANARYQPLTKGLIVEAATRVEESAGESALNAVTFNVVR